MGAATPAGTSQQGGMGVDERGGATHAGRSTVSRRDLSAAGMAAIAFLQIHEGPPYKHMQPTQRSTEVWREPEHTDSDAACPSQRMKGI